MAKVEIASPNFAQSATAAIAVQQFQRAEVLKGAKGLVPVRWEEFHDFGRRWKTSQSARWDQRSGRSDKVARTGAPGSWVRFQRATWSK